MYWYSLNDKTNELPGMGGIFNPVNLNAHQYAGNNPVKLVDPDGNESGYWQMFWRYGFKEPVTTATVKSAQERAYEKVDMERLGVFVGIVSGFTGVPLSGTEYNPVLTMDQIHQYENGFQKGAKYGVWLAYLNIANGVRKLSQEGAVGAAKVGVNNSKQAYIDFVRGLLKSKLPNTNLHTFSSNMESFGFWIGTEINRQSPEVYAKIIKELEVKQPGDE